VAGELAVEEHADLAVVVGKSHFGRHGIPLARRKGCVEAVSWSRISSRVMWASVASPYLPGTPA
jgi:hypothetical protein